MSATFVVTHALCLFMHAHSHAQCALRTSARTMRTFCAGAECRVSAQHSLPHALVRHVRLLGRIRIQGDHTAYARILLMS